MGAAGGGEHVMLGLDPNIFEFSQLVMRFSGRHYGAARE